MTKEKPKINLEVGREYNLYDRWTDWKARAKYLGKASNQHLFVFNEKDNNGYAFLEDHWIVKEEIIIHSGIAPCGFAVISKEELRGSKPENSGLLNSLKQLGENI